MLASFPDFRVDYSSDRRAPPVAIEQTYRLSWSNADIALRFLLGDWCPYIAKFAATVVSEHFAKLPEHPPRTAEVDKWNYGSEVLFVPSHPVRAKLRQVEISGSTIRYVPAQYRRYYITVEGSFSEYTSRFPSKARLELRRKKKRFEESSGSPDCYRSYHLPRDVDEFYRVSLEISKRSFQGKLGVGMPNTEQFRSDLVRLAEEDRVRGFVLFHRQRPVAYQYCLRQRECLICESCGYDPDLARLSPGNVLLLWILEQLFEQQTFKILDFGRGEAGYKAFYGTDYTLCADIYYLRRTLRNASLVAANWGLRTSWAGVSTVLEGLRVKSRLKKLMRAQR